MLACKTENALTLTPAFHRFSKALGSNHAQNTNQHHHASHQNTKQGFSRSLHPHRQIYFDQRISNYTMNMMTMREQENENLIPALMILCFCLAIM